MLVLAVHAPPAQVPLPWHSAARAQSRNPPPHMKMPSMPARAAAAHESRPFKGADWVAKWRRTVLHRSAEEDRVQPGGIDVLRACRAPVHSVVVIPAVRIDGHPAASGLPGHGGDAPRLGQRAVDELLAQRSVVRREVCNSDASCVSETGSTQIEKASLFYRWWAPARRACSTASRARRWRWGRGRTAPAAPLAGRFSAERPRSARCGQQRAFRLPGKSRAGSGLTHCFSQPQ